MATRRISRIVHPVAGVTAFVLILVFQVATLGTELSGNMGAVANAKALIAWALLLLVPAMMAAGGSGMALVNWKARGLAGRKLRRMQIIAANGLLVLVPAALFLNAKAGGGQFDGAFYAVQVIEIGAGCLNFVLLGLNIRDGLRMKGRLPSSPRS